MTSNDRYVPRNDKFPVDQHTGDIRMYGPKDKPESPGVGDIINRLTDDATSSADHRPVPVVQQKVAQPAAAPLAAEKRETERPLVLLPVSDERPESAPAAQSRPIPAGSLRRVEEVRNFYRLILPVATRYEDLFGPEALRITGPLANLLTQGDRFEVIDAGGEFFAEVLLAEHVAGRVARFVEILKVPIGGNAVDEMLGNGTFRVAWAGWEQEKRWTVVRPNGGVARSGILTREEAESDAHTRNAPGFKRQTLG